MIRVGSISAIILIGPASWIWICETIYTFCGIAWCGNPQPKKSKNWI